jgi:putative redox protein
MAVSSERSVEITRLSLGEYEAVNQRGGRLRFASGEQDAFTPVELLLVAIAGCTAADVDYITVKRSEPVEFDVRIRGDKVRDETGNCVKNIRVAVDLTFPEGEAGDAAREILPSAVQRSHDRLCTVSRTVELGTPVEVEIV